MPGCLSIEGAFSRAVFPTSSEPQLAYLLLKLRSSGDPKGTRAPLNWSLVMDRSGSMRGEKIERLKAAVTLVIDRLSASDVLSVVLFNHETKTLISAGTVNDPDSLKKDVQKIKTGGGTMISVGMQAGIKELEKTPSQGRVSRLLLLTDGQTQGDDDICRDTAGRCSQANGPVIALGLGEDWNEDLLQDIARLSGGSWEWITSADQIEAIFEREAKTLEDTMADNVKLTFRFPIGVTVRKVFRVVPLTEEIAFTAVGERDIEVRLGGLTRDIGQGVLAEVLIAPKLERGDYRVAKADLSADFPVLNLYARQASLDMVAAFGPEPSGMNSEVTDYLDKIALVNLQSIATKRMKEGDAAGATKALRNLATKALELGNEDLASTAATEADSLTKTGAMSSSGTKQLISKTRKL